MVIDIECDIPTRETVQKELESIGSGDTRGMVNYLNLFGPRWAADIGMSLMEFEEAKKTVGVGKLWKIVREKALEKAMSEEEFVRMLDEAGVTIACIGTGRFATMEHTASLAQKYKGKFIPWVRISPHEGMAGVRKLEVAVKELGIKGFEASPFREKIYVNDKKYYPFFAKCVELNIPMRSHTSMNYATDRSMDLGRPVYLDEVACDFPELTIIAGLGGWPWVPELVGLARRHQNIYIDLAAHRPKYIGNPGSGFETLLQFGNTVLQDRILFASSWMNLAMPMKQIIQETEELTRNETVKHKWMYENAARILKIT
jgi:predicted TIM-barrel fold metal-dependent hydrolase